MAAAKCKICGTKLNTTTAHLVISYDKNGKEKKAYYCSAAEYQEEEQRKEKAAADKDKAYRLICEIIGRKEIINSILWKEWTVWNKVATNEALGQYLEENKSYLVGAIARLDDKEFNRIRYLSAIIKNKLGDFKPKVKEIRRIPIIQDEHYETKFKPKVRKGLADLEEDCCE